MEPKRILFHLLFTTTVIYLLATYNAIPGLFVSGFYNALVVASLLGLLGIATRTFLVTLHVPVVLLTLTLFAVILNTGMLYFISQFMDHSQYMVDGFLSAFLAGLVLSGAQAIMQWLESIILERADRKLVTH